MNPASLLQAPGDLQFLRPAWLAALLALPLLLAWWRARRRQRNAWRAIVDPHLLPQLLEQGGDRRGRLAAVSGASAFVLAVLALAGPSWRESPQPLWQSRMPLIVALDLSSATMATDLPPSRLTQARAKLATLLRERRGGQVGLVAFAGDAFTVAPLTDDAANVALFLDALQPDVMPVDGQRVDRAIDWSAQLLHRAGADRGDILVLTDHADAAALEAAASAARAGYQVSVLGLGSDAGAVYRRPGGGMATARLDAASLRRFAASGGGRYATLTNGDEDLRALGLLDPGTADGTGTGEAHLVREDNGYWLLPLLMLLALFAFRRRSGVLLVLLVCAWWPLQPARAMELWKRPDQAEHAQLQRGNTAYRRGDYAAAVREYEDIGNATAHYNRGNALAKANQYPQAIAAYDQALRLQPGMADALANKRAVQAAMRRQPPSGSKDQKQQQRQQQQGGRGDPSDPGDGQSGQQSGSPSSDASPRSAQQDAQRERQRSGQPPVASPQDAKPQPSRPADAQAQQAADQAQRERMQRVLREARAKARQSPPSEQVRAGESPEQRERRLANEAWLKRVPDDPGGLLRAKFRLEYERRMLQGRPQE